MIPLHMQLAMEAFQALAKILQGKVAEVGERNKKGLFFLKRGEKEIHPDPCSQIVQLNEDRCFHSNIIIQTFVTFFGYSMHPKSVSARCCSVCHHYTVPSDTVMAPWCPLVYSTPVEPITDGWCSCQAEFTPLWERQSISKAAFFVFFYPSTTI